MTDLYYDLRYAVPLCARSFFTSVSAHPRTLSGAHAAIFTLPTPFCFELPVRDPDHSFSTTPQESNVMIFSIEVSDLRTRTKSSRVCWRSARANDVTTRDAAMRPWRL